MATGQLVLLVDDDEAVRTSLKFALELEGLVVRACASGLELLQHPDLPRAGCLILDYKMPDMDGLEVLDRLTARGPHPEVILITGCAIAPLRQRAAKAAVSYILEKPLSGSALLDSIHHVLAARQ